MTELIKKYNDIMDMYRNGKFGENLLTMSDILEKAGEPDLFDKMNSDEIQYLLNNSSGMTRLLFSEQKKQKVNTPSEIVEQQNFDISKTSCESSFEKDTEFKNQRTSLVQETIDVSNKSNLMEKKKTLKKLEM